MQVRLIGPWIEVPDEVGEIMVSDEFTRNRVMAVTVTLDSKPGWSYEIKVPISYVKEE